MQFCLVVEEMRDIVVSLMGEFCVSDIGASFKYASQVFQVLLCQYRRPAECIGKQVLVTIGGKANLDGIAIHLQRTGYPHITGKCTARSINMLVILRRTTKTVRIRHFRRRLNFVPITALLPIYLH